MKPKQKPKNPQAVDASAPVAGNRLDELYARYARRYVAVALHDHCRYPHHGDDNTVLVVANDREE